MNRRTSFCEEKGDSPHLCEAPSGPFRQMGTVPFFRVWPAALLLAWTCSCGYGQEAPAAKPAAKPPSAKSPYRLLVPGVMQSVDPMRALEESVSRHDVVELLRSRPEVRLGQGHRLPPRHVGVGFPVQADADDLGRYSAAQRNDAAETDLVHGLLGHQHGQGDAPGRGRRSALRDVREEATLPGEDGGPARSVSCPSSCWKAIST